MGNYEPKPHGQYKRKNEPTIDPEVYIDCPDKLCKKRCGFCGNKENLTRVCSTKAHVVRCKGGCKI